MDIKEKVLYSLQTGKSILSHIERLLSHLTPEGYEAVKLLLTTYSPLECDLLRDILRGPVDKHADDHQGVGQKAQPVLSMSQHSFAKAVERWLSEAGYGRCRECRLWLLGIKKSKGLCRACNTKRCRDYRHRRAERLEKQLTASSQAKGEKDSQEKEPQGALS